MGLRDLSEAIILQSAEDLLSMPHEKESIEFFSGEGFSLCAGIAKMTIDEQIKFLNILVKCVSACKKAKNRSDKRGFAEDKGNSKKWAHPHKNRKSVVINAV